MNTNFEFRGEMFCFDDERLVVIADKGEEIEYDSIESFLADAEAEGDIGVLGLSGWEY